MTRKSTRRPKPLPKPRTMRVPETDYQPSCAELREEMDMPKASRKKIRDAFVQPFDFVKE